MPNMRRIGCLEQHIFELNLDSLKCKSSRIDYLQLLRPEDGPPSPFLLSPRLNSSCMYLSFFVVWFPKLQNNHRRADWSRDWRVRGQNFKCRKINKYCMINWDDFSAIYIYNTIFILDILSLFSLCMYLFKSPHFLNK